jgi:hypothetical protein
MDRTLSARICAVSLAVVFLGGVALPTDVVAGKNVKNSTRTSVNNNRNTNVNVKSNRNVNVDIDVDNDRHHHHHPVGTAVAVTTAAVVTAAVVGSVVHTIPPTCVPVQIGYAIYQQCGATWYQPQYVGSSVQYVVINPPR